MTLYEVEEFDSSFHFHRVRTNSNATFPWSQMKARGRGRCCNSVISDSQITGIVNASPADIYRSEEPHFENSSQNESTRFASFCEFVMNTEILSIFRGQH